MVTKDGHVGAVSWLETAAEGVPGGIGLEVTPDKANGGFCCDGLFFLFQSNHCTFYARQHEKRKMQVRKRVGAHMRVPAKKLLQPHGKHLFLPTTRLKVILQETNKKFL